MPLRIAFDLDGVLADFAAAYDRIADRLFPDSRLPAAAPAQAAGAGEGGRQGALSAEAAGVESAPAARGGERGRPGAPSVDVAGAVEAVEAVERPAAVAPAAGEGDAVGAPAEPPPVGVARASTEALARDVRLSPRRRDRVWKEIRSTPDFWLTLAPVDPAVVARLHERAVARRWETFFVTQRPATAGDTVQRQTQRWLVEQGFALPSVVVHDGSRGRLAAALELDFLVDDTVRHCVDAVSQSSAKAVLVAPEADASTEANARRLGIEVCRGPADALDLLDLAAAGRLAAFLHRARRAIEG